MRFQSLARDLSSQMPHGAAKKEKKKKKEEEEGRKKVENVGEPGR